MLIEVVMLQLQALPDSAELFFQQDGAPQHYSLAVHQYLDQACPHHWTGRHGSIYWPSRFPDLTPMDCFLWRIVKDKGCSRKLATVRQFNNFIDGALEEIRSNRNLCRTVWVSVGDRLLKCICTKVWTF
ncbi:uncharacterized protein TNIN_124911 [Trichonephila inaurata madagascariensis]|uniref:Transposase n=1 Tax=Trichonephila inaurata madagascariensis TaxID=2747483 RepID=A0A8X6MK72_9ARAC|nr:uncharacterized protein TNIN_276771 [Trichonephila inaurata madagascariensis]GFS66068.1 uncharacterized protein TNIN_124911 [Trichonephila inaurata madagascariensis]